MEDLVLLILILIIPGIASIGVNSNFNKYLKVKHKKGMTGQEVARAILDKHGLQNVYVVAIDGKLTDHYDPKRKTVRLSKAIYEGTSIASISVAAHECGHAIQDKENYSFFRIRSLIVKPVNIATTMSYFIILVGILLEAMDLIYLGIGFTALGLVFQLVTLPVEFNASKRAKEELSNMHIVSDEEKHGVKKMLSSAAMTYVAGILASLLQIIRLLLAFNRKR